MANYQLMTNDQSPSCRRFGTVTSCDIVRDYKTGDSLSYAFVGEGGAD
jgi:hypothetical protein